MEKGTYKILFENVYYMGKFSMNESILFSHNGKPLHGKLLTDSSKLIGHFVNGKPHGEFFLYDTLTDDLVCKGTYQLGLKTGVWKKYFNNSLIEEQSFLSGFAEGEVKQYGMDNEVLYRKGFYKNNKKHGKWSYFYKDGKVFCDGLYEEGFKIGTWNRYQKNGHLQKTIHYNDSLPFMSKRFHLKGYLEVEAKCEGNQCEYIEYYENGQVKLKLSYFNVYSDKILEEDYLQVYQYNYDDYLNDSTFVKQHIVMDDEGLHDYLFNDGLLISYAISFYGYRNGAYFEYYPDGTLKVNGQFRKDKMIGLWSYFNENGEEGSTIVFDKNMVIN